MNEINEINFRFNRFVDGGLSEQTTSYIRSLKIKDKVDVYLEVLEGFQDSEVGWALIPERKVYIRPTEEIEKFELRLVHELTHIALADEGYRLISCFEGDTLCSSFANLLHHLVLYPRLVESGFSLTEDTYMVFAKLRENIQGYKEVSINYGTEGYANSVVRIINDLIRLEPSRKEEYLLEANKQIFDLIQKAQNILMQGEKLTLDVEGYEQYKILLENELDINSKYPWLEN